jgi:hypothetical protein
MSMVKSNREIWGVDFPWAANPAKNAGLWDAGVTAPHAPGEKAGRWTVRREAECFAVYFHAFQSGAEALLKEFPPNEQGEIDAKVFALASRTNGIQS